ncbi:COF1 protein, partial [Amia calva]|nr:COF1 protein [Amia calva]
MKVRKAGECESDRLKLVLFRVSDDGKEIVVDKGKQIFNRDLKSDEDVFKRVISQFPEKECRYALYDTCYETKESKKEDLVFITWVPDTAAIKSKMLYASSKKALSDKMKGNLL